MILNVKMFLIVCPMVFLGSFMDAIAGGGGLVTLPAYLLAGLPMHLAIGSNKMSSTLGTAVSTARYWKNKCVESRLIIPTAIAAIVGASIGSRLSLMVDESVLKTVLIFVLPVVAVLVFKNKNLEPKFSLNTSQQMAAAVVSAFVIGTYDGFYGPGTGTFLIMAFTMICGLDTLKAAGNCKVCNFSSNIASFVTFLISGDILIPLAASAAVFSILGNWLGSGVALKNGSRIVRPVVVIVLCILFVKVITEIV